MSGSRTLTGTLLLRDPAPVGAVVRLKVEDVSRLDAAAVTVAEATFRLDVAAATGTRVPFSLAVQAVDDRASYSMRAHVDTTGSNSITAGDLVSTRAFPVLSPSAADTVEVEVHKV